VRANDGSTSGARSRASLRSRGVPVPSLALRFRPCACRGRTCLGPPRLYPAPAEALAHGALRGVERRLQPEAADNDHVAAGSEHARHLVEENRHADLSYQVHRAVGEGQPLSIADQELDAPRQGSGKLRPRPLDHRLRDVQARDPRLRKLSREPQRSRACSGAEVEGPGRRRLETGDRGGQRRQVLRRVGPHALVPALRRAVEEAAHEPPDQRPRPGARATILVSALPIARTGSDGGGLVRSGCSAMSRP
jgi:hypothetical protein